MTTIAPTLGTWTRGQRLQLSVIVAVIAMLHVLGWSLYLSVTHGSAGAGAFAGAGVLAYVLGIRHAFHADHNRRYGSPGSGDLKETGPGRATP
jgi:nickel/cobalt transporter (NiCoT) family protein